MMRKIDWLHHTPSRQLVEHFHEINLFSAPFSDGDILDLQEKFLTNGFQYLKAQNVFKGRELIHDFLQSLSLYHEIGCLTVAPRPQLKEGIVDLYYELTCGGYLNTFDQNFLDEFFIDQFYFDFIWIEATRSLLMTTWFEDIKKKIIDMAIDEHLPIMVIVYEEQ